jgi:hypothetical protein
MHPSLSILASAGTLHNCRPLPTSSHLVPTLYSWHKISSGEENVMQVVVLLPSLASVSIMHEIILLFRDVGPAVMHTCVASVHACMNVEYEGARTSVDAP